MFDNIIKFFKKFGKNEKEDSKNMAKERLHLVLAQDRANISADFLEMMKQEIIEVIKKYIDIDEEAIDVRLTNKPGEDGVVGAPSLYANIPIVTIKNETRKLDNAIKEDKKEKQEETEKVEQEENKQSQEIEKIEDEQETKETQEVKKQEEQTDIAEENEEEKEDQDKEVSEEKIENKEVKNEKKNS